MTFATSNSLSTCQKWQSKSSRNFQKLTKTLKKTLRIHYQHVKSGKSVFKKMSSNSLLKCESKSKPVENIFKHWFSVLGLARILLKEFAICSFKNFELQQWK